MSADSDTDRKTLATEDMTTHCTVESRLVPGKIRLKLIFYNVIIIVPLMRIDRNGSKHTGHFKEADDGTRCAGLGLSLLDN